jgi:hypothetical protein
MQCNESDDHAAFTQHHLGRGVSSLHGAIATEGVQALNRLRKK